MRISSGNPNKAQAFIAGKWSCWMDRNEAQKLEDMQNWGATPKGIIPFAVAQRMGVAPAGARNTSKSEGAH